MTEKLVSAINLPKWLRCDPDAYGVNENKKRSIKYHRQMRLAEPAWANRKAIAKIYRRAKELGMVVDHIVPLCSEYVCGLHCEANLQLLGEAANIRKGNRYWPDSPFENRDLFGLEECEQYELPL